MTLHSSFVVQIPRKILICFIAAVMIFPGKFGASVIMQHYILDGRMIETWKFIALQ